MTTIAYKDGILAADTPKAAHAIVEAEFNRLEAYKTRKISP